MSDNITKRVGLGTAYGFAKAGGYEGTVAEFTELLGNIAIDLARIENLSVTVTTLPAGSQATASLNGSVLSLGIPKGDKGDKGNTGETGAPAGFGTVSATVDDNIGTPSVEVTASGADTANQLITEVDWKMVLLSAFSASVYSLLTSILAGLPEVNTLNTLYALDNDPDEEDEEDEAE